MSNCSLHSPMPSEHVFLSELFSFSPHSLWLVMLAFFLFFKSAKLFHTFRSTSSSGVLWFFSRDLLSSLKQIPLPQKDLPWQPCLKSHQWTSIAADFNPPQWLWLYHVFFLFACLCTSLLICFFYLSRPQNIISMRVGAMSSSH